MTEKKKAAAGAGGARKRRSRSPRKAGAAVHRESPHTSHPTSRAAYLETYAPDANYARLAEIYRAAVARRRASRSR